MSNQIKDIEQIREIVAKAKERDAALAKVRQLVRTNASIRSGIIEWGINELVRELWRHHRWPYWQLGSGKALLPAQPRTDLKAGARQVATEIARTIMDYPMPHGKRLGETTKVELIKLSLDFRKEGASLLIRANWFNDMASRMGRGDQKVANAFNEEQVEKLRQKASAMIEGLPIKVA